MTEVATDSWNNSFCCPCSIKGAGCVPCCCPNFCCPCMPMMWASAMSQIKGKDYNYMVCCLGAQCCPICTFGYTMMDLSKHYGISENMWWCKCCLPVLSLYQIFDTVLVKEGLHMTVAAVAPDTAAAGAPPGPESEAMER